MKFLMVIVNEEHQKKVSDIFNDNDCSATMIASTGDFLEYGETIFLLAIDEQKVDIVLELIEKEMGIWQEAKGVATSSQEKESHPRMLAYRMDIHQFLKVGGGNNIHDRGKSEGTKL